jgi:hypothetical protein
LSKGLDTYKNMTDYGQALADAGVQFVGRYLSNGVGTIHDAFLEAEAAHLCAHGLKIVSILELGRPDHDAYFTVEQANRNVETAVAFAKLAGQPKGTEIFSAIDYDATVNAVHDYIIALHNGLKSAGYLHSVYANGTVCQWAKQDGYAHHTWLAEGAGMSGYEGWKSNADIVQERTGTFHGLDVDFDVAKTADCGWWGI